MQPSVTRTHLQPHVVLRRFADEDLPALVALWNTAFEDRHNFQPVTEEAFWARVLASPAFENGGLILAWARNESSSQLVGFVHAFKPPPKLGQYRRWAAQHHIALLYVKPNYRRQGIGGRLLQAAENWLYYCPVHVASDAMPCYGAIEGPMSPFFGSTERLGIEAAGTDEEQALVHFLARRGYAVDDAGDVSMSLDLRLQHPLPSSAARPESWGLRVVSIDNERPFAGLEPRGREEYSLWGDNDGHAYGGIVLVDDRGLLRGHISWYPMPDQTTDAVPRKVALSHFWLAPALRGHGLGGHLFDLGLHAMSEVAPVRVELHTHLLHHDRAVTLYESRGFQIDRAWVKLVKT